MYATRALDADREMCLRRRHSGTAVSCSCVRMNCPAMLWLSANISTFISNMTSTDLQTNWFFRAAECKLAGLELSGVDSW